MWDRFVALVVECHPDLEHRNISRRISRKARREWRMSAEKNGALTESGQFLTGGDEWDIDA